jgi:hypothetical protein
VSIVVIGLLLILSCPYASAQTSRAFDPNTKFSLPAYDGSISFAVNGSYSNATFEGDAWIFNDLRLNQSQPMPYLELSARNSDIVVSYYGGSSFFPGDMLGYFAQGLGQQVINMGIANAGNKVDWVVFSNGTFVSNGWNVSHNGTVTVTGLTGNITVIYFGFTDELGNSNLPFYEQHSVAIATAIALTATVGAAVAVNVFAKRRSVRSQSGPLKEAKP